MANKYYYLTSSLPHISFGNILPITEDAFIKECRKWLADGDLNALLAIKEININKDTGDKNFAKEWVEFDASLRNKLAQARSMRKMHHEERIHGLTKEILGQSNPQEAEEKFEKLRWSFLDEKEKDFHFDLNWLIVYFLKLKILGRLSRFEKEKGTHIFENLCEVRYE